MKILFVIPDNQSYISYFPLGPAYLASVLRKHNHHVTIWSQDVYHYPDSDLLDYLDYHEFDTVGMGFMAGYWPYRKAIDLSKMINESKNRSKFRFIIGGHGPSPEPAYFQKKLGCDIVFAGEAENTILQSIDTKMRANFWGTCVPPDVNKIPYPSWDLFPIDHYALTRLPGFKPTDRVMPVLSGRGCPFECSFCYRMHAGYRPRSSTDIAKEIDTLQAIYGITAIDFADELFMTSDDRITELCAILSDACVKWSCNGRLNYASKENLKVMKDAGCTHINYGIESMDQDVRKLMKKGLTNKQIIKGIENTLEVDIHPGLNMLWGNPGDTIESLWKGVNFIRQYSDASQLRTIRPVTPYPGSPLYYEAIKRSLLKDVADFYENKHVNSDLFTVNFMDIPIEKAHLKLCEANKILIEAYYDNHKYSTLNQANILYRDCQNPHEFRGFRQI